MSSLGEEDTVLGSTMQPLGVARSHPAVRMAHANVMERLFGDPSDATPIGRYVPRKKLGAGANGVVYLATDDVLKRDVALKVLAGVDGSDSLGSAAAQRWLREAQAVARVSHPHVVEIFDVGLDGGHPYLAMELVEGGSLAEWLVARERTASEIVEVFVQAGEGLAAAHRLGVVHRDFKPANVLVGRDGRVRVADFGLAGFLHDTDTDEVTREPSAPASRSGGSTRLTHTGLVMGTPAYMAPEQHRGARVDARADQFSFCAALWGALSGAPPFAGDSIAAIYTAKVDRSLARPLPTSGVAPTLRDALLRGLAPDPADRFATMEALLSAIRPAPRRAERWVWGACASALVAFAGVLALLPSAHDPCGRVHEELRDAWNPDARDRIATALAGAGADELSARVGGRLDAFVRDFTTARADACERGRVAEGDEAARVDGAVQCLRQAEGRLRATLEMLESVDSTSIAQVPELLHLLGEPAECRADEGAPAGPPRPRDPALAAIVDDARAQRARLQPLIQSRRIEADDPRIESLVAAAEASGYGPLRAEMHVVSGRLLTGAGDWPAAAAQYEAAYALAVEHEHDEMAFDSAVTLARLDAEPLASPAEADRWIAYAQAALVRMGDPADARARYEEGRGIVARSKGEVSAALAHFSAAVDHYARAAGEMPWLHATALHNYANALGAAGRIDEALAARERAIAELERELGADHPITGGVRYAYGADLQTVGRLDEAQATLERTLVGLRRRVAPDHPWIVKTLNELALLLRRQRAPELARDRFIEAYTLAERTKGAERDELVLGIGSNLAEVHIELDDAAAAEPLLREMVALGDRLHGEDDMRVAMNRVRLARALLQQGRGTEALEVAQRALRHAQAAGAGDVAAHARLELSRILAADDRAEARSLAEAALAYWKDPGDAHSEATPFADSAAENAAILEAWLSELR